MYFLHAPFVLFRFGFFDVMLISDIKNQHLVCIFLRPHRSAEFRPLEETVCGKQSAYCSVILHPHLMINLGFFLFFVGLRFFFLPFSHFYADFLHPFKSENYLKKSESDTSFVFFKAGRHSTRN